MDNAYPYLIKNPRTGIEHVVSLESWAGGVDEMTGCGHLVDKLDYNETARPIKRAIQERTICLNCLGSERLLNFISIEFQEKDAPA